MAPRRHWIVTTDSRRASLFSCEKTPGGELHLTQVRSIENTHEAEHERHRPDSMGGAERRGSMTSSGAAAAPHNVAQGHTEEEEHRRFAREVGAWLGGVAKEVGDGRVSIFAPARLLGLLRSEFPTVAGGAAPDFREAELNHLRPGELALHPAVLEAVTRGAAPGR